MCLCLAGLTQALCGSLCSLSVVRLVGFWPKLISSYILFKLWGWMETRPHTLPVALHLLSDADTEKSPYNHLHWQESGLGDLPGLSGLWFFLWFNYVWISLEKQLCGRGIFLLQWWLMSFPALVSTDDLCLSPFHQFCLSVQRLLSRWGFLCTWGFMSNWKESYRLQWQTELCSLCLGQSWQLAAKISEISCRRSTSCWSAPLPMRDLSLLLMTVGNTLREKVFLSPTDFSTMKQTGKANKVGCFLLFNFFFPKQNCHLSSELSRSRFLGKTTILLKCQGEILY